MLASCWVKRCVQPPPALKENKEAMFQPQQAAELGSFGHMVLALESRVEERDYGTSLHDYGKLLRPGVSLCGGPEKPMLKTVKLKSGLPWRPQDVGSDNAMQLPVKESW